MKRDVLFLMVFLGTLCVWGCSDKSGELKSGGLWVSSVDKDSDGQLNVRQYEVDQENQLYTKRGGVVDPSVALFKVDGKSVTREEYVDVFNQHSKQGTIEFMRQDTICFYCDTKD